MEHDWLVRYISYLALYVALLLVMSYYSTTKKHSRKAPRVRGFSTVLKDYLVFFVFFSASFTFET
jgi:hypothetical protein